MPSSGSMKKPSFDLSDLRGSTSLSKCKDFLPQLQASNHQLFETISKGGQDHVIDADMHVYHGNHCPEAVTGDGGEIVLDVGVGVFDVNNSSVDDSSLRASGVTTVSLDPSSEVFRKDQQLIIEVESRDHGK
ncbi:hypothetical protein BaOVIS_010640 [Babesia ovis]|uniref:Uncharacterized protein n=1 Tax=Babesia ovis TaxID=5869 RepID=A0A9W5TA22_BABOV|nr:hypothetical protein BaOVIS_010640 [Babesia ovis]